MPVEVLARSLAERRRSTIGWVVGVAAYTLLNVAVYPQVKQQSGLNDLMKDYPPALMAMFGIDAKSMDLTSSVGYLGSQLGLIGPLLLVMVGVAFAASTLAGEEESGTLGLVLSYPVTRGRVVLEKAAGLVVVVGVVGLGLMASIVAGRVFELEIPVRGLVGFCAAVVLLGVLFGLIALAVGAATGSKSLATGVSATVAGATYLISSLSSVVPGLRPLRWISPFWYATGSNPLANGLGLADLAVLVGLSAVVLVLAVVVFDRRDLRS
jgi:ABC-2 type transport system permease protein